MYIVTNCFFAIASFSWRGVCYKKHGFRRRRRRCYMHALEFFFLLLIPWPLTSETGSQQKSNKLGGAISFIVRHRAGIHRKQFVPGINWSIDRSIDQLIDGWPNPMINRLIDRLIDDRSIDWSINEWIDPLLLIHMFWIKSTAIW